MNIEKNISADDHEHEIPDSCEPRLPANLRAEAPKVMRLDKGGAEWAWGLRADFSNSVVIRELA